jgi:tetratricopeptide (TPR) repeat protein
MSRWYTVLVLAGLALGSAGAQEPDAKRPTLRHDEDVQLPPDEDAGAKPQVFVFNPVKSKQDVTVGTYYFKKGDFRAALDRYVEATKWNDGNADAWLRVGETREKMNDPKGAREAYERYLQLSPDAKNAGEVKKRLEKLK